MPHGREMTDEQRKAMFAHMRGGSGGGGGGVGGMGRAGSAAPPSGPSTPDPFPPMDPNDMSWMEAEGRGISTSLTPFDAVLDSMIDMSDPNTGLALAAASAVITPSGSKRVLPLTKQLLQKGLLAIKRLMVPAGATATAYGISEFRDHNPTIDPRTDHYLALAQDTAAAIAALSGITAAKRAIGSIPGMSRVGDWFGAQGDKVAAMQATVAARTPGAIKTPLNAAWKAYNAVAGFTGTEIREFSQIPKIGTTFRDAKALDEVARRYADSAARTMPGDPTRSRWLADQADHFNAMAAAKRQEALGAAARAAYVAGGIAAVHTTEQAVKDQYRKEMDAAFAQGKPYILSPDSDIAATPTMQAAMFAIGTLGNPVEKQTRDYIGGHWSKTLAERAYQEYQYDQIEAARRSFEITDPEADRLQVERAKDRPRNMAGKSVYSFTPALAGFAKFAVGQAAKAVKYGDPAEVQKLYSPQHAAGVGLMAYGNTLGSRLPAAVPVAWNAFLAAQGVNQAATFGPKNQRGKVFRPMQIEGKATGWWR